MGGMCARVARGAVAGAVGTLALDTTTYLDMALRKRPASATPARTAELLASRLRLRLPEDPAPRDARLTGMGAALGTAAGVSSGVVLALLREGGRTPGWVTSTGAAWVLAMLVGNGPMTLLGVTDPRTWSATDWAADVVPHLAYAAAATATLRAFEAT